MNKILQERPKEILSKLLISSIESQEVNVSEEAEIYIVEVISNLSSVTHGMASRPIYLVDLLRKGLDSHGFIRREYLRLTGDVALFVSGIFPDSLDSRGMAFDVGDFIDIGQSAYSNIQGAIFDELAQSFPDLVDVLNSVSLELDLISRDISKYVKRRRLIDVRTAQRPNGNLWKPRV